MNLKDFVSRPRLLSRLLRGAKSFFTFTQERTNRVVRFARIVRDYKTGRMLNDIEKEYGCSRSTIFRYVHLMGLPSRGQERRRTPTQVRAECIRLYKAKAPIKDIAKKLDVSEAYVSRTATEEGINRRNFKRKK